jgi:hypothetical protein
MTGHWGVTIMTHVWLTGTLRSAFANCLPVHELEAVHHRFHYSKPGQGFSHESMPCRSRAHHMP